MTSVCQCLQRNSKSAAVCPMLYLGIFLSNSSIETNGSEKILEMKKQIIQKQKSIKIYTQNLPELKSECNLNNFRAFSVLP